MSVLKRQVARAFKPLLAPSRYKGAHGGRGSGKSHFFAEQLLINAISNPGYRVACIREVQRTLAQSVKRLIEDKIEQFGVSQYFEVQEAQIKTHGGGVIIFQGMQNHTADSIKSLEGFDLAYVEEAQSLSQRSLDLLRPTIRKEASEIWFAWNPRLDSDAVDMFFRGKAAPPGAIVVEANWSDNPFFPDVLRREMAHDYATDPEKASHIWGGGYEVVTEGSYYARLMIEAERDGRIGAFPYDPSLPVITSWDIGVDDYTAIWFFQENGKQVRAIDYYETSGDGAQMIVEDALKSKPYKYAKHYLPHDVTVREWGAGAKSRIQTLRELGVNPVLVGVAQGPEERINASRSIMPMVSFDAQKTDLGRKRLRNYRRRWSEPLQTFQGPLHDDNSHGADAFGEFAVNCGIRPRIAEPPKKPRDKYDRDDDEDKVSWMTA